MERSSGYGDVICQLKLNPLKTNNEIKYNRGFRFLKILLLIVITSIIGGYIGCHYLANSFAESVKDGVTKYKSNRERNLEARKPSSKRPKLFTISTSELNSLNDGTINIGGEQVSIEEILNLKLIPGDADDEENNLFPSQIFEFTNLEYLWIGMRGFEVMPEGVARLTKLKSIDFQHGSINKLPTDISELQQLEWLNLLWTSVNELPDNFSELNNLRYLHLGCTQFESIPSELYDMNNLETLILSHDDECQEKRIVFKESETVELKRILTNTELKIGR